MDTTHILSDLRAERGRIEQAIAAIEALETTANLSPRTTAAKAAPRRARRRGLTPAGRKRISEMMKARWAQRRKQAAKPAAKRAGAGRHMSAAARRKIAAAQRARWAARKKVATTQAANPQ